ncbi:hypothetical protein [Saccharomonospora iraqiensis]|uniref:hypothetical protein n=1 Tax=Saccharomonospora iraqiensis TaxID=52698 RepID=UPI00022E15C7|nr:hypothetical protein [Saccharomonospora iraqiensis]
MARFRLNDPFGRRDQPPEFTGTEQELRAALHEGRPLTLGDTVPPPGHPGHTVRASAIAYLLLVEEGVHARSRRLELHGAEIVGDLDLADSVLRFPVVFAHCRFRGDLDLSDAATARVELTDCVVPRVVAPRLQCSGSLMLHGVRETSTVNLEDAHVSGGVELADCHLAAEGHALNLSSARVTGDVTLARTVVDGDETTTVNLLAVRVEGTLDVTGFRSPGALFLAGAEVQQFLWLSGSRLGAVDGSSSRIGLGMYAERMSTTKGFAFRSARVGGDIRLDGAELRAGTGWGLNLYRADVFGTVRLRNGFTCRAPMGAILDHATVTGDVRLDDADVDAPDHALSLANATVSGGVAARAPARVAGRITLDSARVEGVFRMESAELSAGSGAVSISAFAATVRAEFALVGATRVTGRIRLTDCDTGTLRLTESVLLGDDDGAALNLTGNTVSGDLVLNGVESLGRIRLRNNTVQGSHLLDGAHLRADRHDQQGRRIALEVSALSVGKNLTMTEATVDGAVRVAYSHIAQVVTITDCVLAGGRTDPTDPPMSLDLGGTTVGRHLSLSRTRSTRTVRLTTTTVHGDVGLDDTVLDDRDLALDAAELTASTLIFLPARAPTGRVDLSHARLGTLRDRVRAWSYAHGFLDLAGCAYDRLDGAMTLKQRLHWVHSATEPFMPGPYEQLAASFSATGEESEARTTRLAAVRRSSSELTQNTRRNRPGAPTRDGPPGPPARWTSRVVGVLRHLVQRGYQLWGALQDLVLGYGYRPLRAVVVFLLAWSSGAVAFAWGTGPCLRSGTAVPGPCPVRVDEHPTWDPFLYALDVLVPVVDLGHATAWDVLGWSKAVMLVLTVAGWVLATTIIAAFGRTLRRR